MVARDIVPFDTISVEIVQDSNADLVAITVIRLSFGSRFLSVISNTKIRTNPDYDFFLKLTLRYETKIFGLERNLHGH